MAPRLSAAQHAQIADMLRSDVTIGEIANTVPCTQSAVRRIRTNLQCFGTTTAPKVRAGRPKTLTPPMLTRLLAELREYPDMLLGEMATFLKGIYGVSVAISTISTSLVSVGWSKKSLRRVAQERNADLCDFYLHQVSAFSSYQLVFVDESGCDKRAGLRRTGWSPRGVTPVQVARFHRGARYQILPAYAQDGVVLSRIFQGSTDAAVFEDFIEQLPA